MTGRKNVLTPVVIASNQSLATSFTSTPTIVDYLDNVSYQINVSTTDSAGTFAVQASLDYFPGDANNKPVAGNWADLELSRVPTVASASDVILISLNQVPFRALRIAYTSTTAGTGTCNIIIEAKMV